MPNITSTERGDYLLQLSNHVSLLLHIMWSDIRSILTFINIDAKSYMAPYWLKSDVPYFFIIITLNH